ncbi:hypothetical protein FQZ97_760490 [compost metagenome]
MLEHLTQELGRLLVAVSDQLLASVVLFLRSGIWAVIATALMFIEPASRTLDFVLGAWTIGGGIALLLGVFRLRQLKISGWHRKVDWGWVGKGLKVAIPFLLATLSIRGIFTIDRYWFEELSGLEMLGAYVLFVGLCSALISFLDAGVFAFIYPGLIGAYQKKNVEEFNRGLRKLLVQTVVFSAFFALVSLLLIGPLLGWLNKPLYLEQQGLFPWILLANLFYALGMIPHYALYAQGRDRLIINSHIAGLVVFIPAVWMFSQQWPRLAIPLGLCVAFLLILLWKSLAYFRLSPVQYRSLRP